MVGKSAEVTITRCVQEAVRLSESVAVQVMIVVPTGYGSVNSRLQGSPISGWQSLSLRVPLTDTPVPVAEGGVTATVASPCPLGAAAVKSGSGHVIVGAGETPGSITVTVKLHEPPDPPPDVTLTGLVPIGKVEPDAGV